MKVRLAMRVAVVALSGALSGCVSIGGIDALITPIGVAGIHSFEPADSVQDIELPEQQNPDRMAANQQREEKKEKEDK